MGSLVVTLTDLSYTPYIPKNKKQPILPNKGHIGIQTQWKLITGNDLKLLLWNWCRSTAMGREMTGGRRRWKLHLRGGGEQEHCGIYNSMHILLTPYRPNHKKQTILPNKGEIGTQTLW